MLITRRFLYIHFPKTAGLWTKQAITQSHIELFMHNTPIGDLFFTLGKWFPFLRPAISRIARRLVVFDYSSHNLATLSFRSYHIPPGRPVLKWFLLIAEAMFFLDKNYETLLKLPRHTRYAQLPKEFQELPLVSGIRDPFSWHISRYLYYKNWQQKEGASESQDIIESIGDITDFNDYLTKKMMMIQNGFFQGYNNYLKLHKNKEVVQHHPELLSFHKPGEDSSPPVKHYGLMTLRFIQIYFKRPWEVINLSPKEFAKYWHSGDYKDNLPKIKFIEQPNIKQELREYMLALKYKEDILSKIEDIPRKNVSSSKNEDTSLSKFYKSRKALERIHALEKPVFILFPIYEELFQQIVK